MAEHDGALKVARFVRDKYPDIKILARTRDIFHTFEFFRLGVRDTQREMFNSATELGAKALNNLGFTRYEAYRAARTFKHHEEEVMKELYKHWQKDESKFIQETRMFSEQLQETLQTERNYSIHDNDDAWDSRTLREEALKNKKNNNSD